MSSLERGCVLCRRRPPLGLQRKVKTTRKPCHPTTWTPRSSSMVGSTASPEAIYWYITEKYHCSWSVLVSCSLFDQLFSGSQLLRRPEMTLRRLRKLFGKWMIKSGLFKTTFFKEMKEVGFEIKWECSELVFRMQLELSLVFECLQQSALRCGW